MHFPNLIPLLLHILLVIVCICSLVSPCSGDSSRRHGGLPPCIVEHRHRRHNFSSRAVVESAQARAYLSPVVFLGTLRSVLVQRDGTVRAWFVLDVPLKALIRKDQDTEVVYHRLGEGLCLLEVNQDNLKLGAQYLVFGAPMASGRPSLAATALPIPNEKRTLRAVKKVLCPGCAKAPSIAGLKRVKVVEGGKVQLHCHLSGYPLPWVEWYKDGKKVIPRGRLRVRTKRRTSRLVIRRARPSDKGRYECRASNVVQTDPVSASATVTVTRKRKKTYPPSTSPAPTTVTSTESSPWTTEPCPSSDFCLNGGTCIFYKDVREYVCHCAEGYVGLRCHYKDVSVSVGEVKKLDQNHDRFFIAVVVLFLIFFCFNWAGIGLCWLCCFRRQQNDWGKLQKMAPRDVIMLCCKLDYDHTTSNMASPSEEVVSHDIQLDEERRGDETNVSRDAGKTN